MADRGGHRVVKCQPTIQCDCGTTRDETSDGAAEAWIVAHLAACGGSAVIITTYRREPLAA